MRIEHTSTIFFCRKHESSVVGRGKNYACLVPGKDSLPLGEAEAKLHRDKAGNLLLLALRILHVTKERSATYPKGKSHQLNTNHR